MATDIEISQAAQPRPIVEVAAELGLGEDDIVPFGRHKAKIPPGSEGASRGKLVLITAVTPTPAGEGKSTCTIGLGDALRRLGKKALVCIREPSLGPVFGMKGGAAGGGYAQVIPMESINLHFTGDLHAITSAHNLLSALVDNHLHHGNALGIDPRRITWPRTIDMNDRSLRSTVVGLGGTANGPVREDGYVITPASEVMAVLCLARDLEDLRARLDRIIVGYTRDRQPIRAADLQATGAMTMLLAEAMQPNLVQTLEGGPALVHGGPFANIAHGCSSLAATRLGLSLADVVLTEAGFGADLGAEKFFDIKCREGGLEPQAAVVVATVRALKMHGDVDKDALATPDLAAVERGLGNLRAHVENVQRFGVPVVVAVNRFATDTEDELKAVLEGARGLGVRAEVMDAWGQGGAGGEAVGEALLATLEEGRAAFEPLYAVDRPLREKIETIAQKIYGADGVDFGPDATRALKQIERIGLGGTPVCMAKTQYSLSDDPTKRGRPKDFRITVRDAYVSAGAGFTVALTSNVMTMPGLPREPAAAKMGVSAAGKIEGLF
ncbi:MAG: formate--tetrahydrofolate ligase [Deltaproteobacteria bacterium]|jgi:formate--tetrahydrofolate ligase